MVRILILLLTLQIAGVPAWAITNIDISTSHTSNTLGDMDGQIDSQMSGLHTQTCCTTDTNTQRLDDCAFNCLMGCAVIAVLVSEANLSQTKLVEHPPLVLYTPYNSLNSPPDTPPPSA